MSVWTHVASNFRFNSVGYISDEIIYEVMGQPLLYNDPGSKWNYAEDHRDEFLPMGSEGSLEISIWHDPDTECMASTSVSVFGDLRDYDSFDELEKWFNKVCKKMWTRQAVMQVEVEGQGTKVFEYCR